MLSQVEQALDRFFQMERIGPDPAFSRFIPIAYDSIGFDWRGAFEVRFCHLFNGMMIRGQEQVNRVFLAVFPSDDVLARFLAQAAPGDLLFIHHPLLMECGDPKGKWGRGFVPIQGEYLFQLKQKQVSVYTCHTPLDVHPEISTNRAIAQVLNVKPEAEFFHTEQGACGLIGTLPPISTDELIARSQRIFSIPYVDFAGKKQEAITQIAIVAGCGDRTEVMEEAEAKGAQAYLTGEIHCHIDNEYGKYRYRQMMDYIPNTSMSLIGVSHAASEFLVMKIQMKKWFERHFALEAILLPQQLWWL